MVRERRGAYKIKRKEVVKQHYRTNSVGPTGQRRRKSTSSSSMELHVKHNTINIHEKYSNLKCSLNLTN